MKKPTSITRRLTFGLVFGVVVFWLGAVGIAGFVVQHELNEAFDQTLEQAAIRLLPLAIHDIEEMNEGERENEYRIGSLKNFDSNFAYYIRNESGARIALSEDLQSDINSEDVPNGFTNIGSVRYFAITDQESGFGIVIAENSDHRKTALWESVLALLWPLAGLIPLMIGGVWYAVRLSLRPIKALQTDISKRDGSNLSPLSEDSYPRELAPIAQAIADLLDRLGSALNAEKTFAANSAHELRTPLAGALAQVQRLSIELNGREGERRVADIEKSLRHLSDLAEKLLQLSRLESGFAKSNTVVELMPILELTLQDFMADTQNGGRINFINPDGLQLKAKISKDAFAIIIRNLIENALIHGSTDGSIDIKLENKTSLSVANDCFIIPDEKLKRLGEPFERGDATTKGTGLGLSIVKSILDQCGGELSLFSPQKNQQKNFEVLIVLNAKMDSSLAS